MRDMLKIDGEPLDVSTSVDADGVATVVLGEREYMVSKVDRDSDELRFQHEGTMHSLHVRQTADFIEVTDGRCYQRFTRVVAGAVEEDEAGGALTSQMPGTVLKLIVAPGSEVTKGTPLLILEAMKMEHEVCAPGAGTVDAYPFAEGDRVMPGDLLVEFTAANESG